MATYLRGFAGRYKLVVVGPTLAQNAETFSDDVTSRDKYLQSTNYSFSKSFHSPVKPSSGLEFLILRSFSNLE